MAVCKMEMVAVGHNAGLESVVVRGRLASAKTTTHQQQQQQRVRMVMVRRSASSSSSQQQQKKKRWPSSSVLVSTPRVAVVLPTTTTTTCPTKLRRLRCNATSSGSGGDDNADPPQKGYDISEVVEKVTHEEKDQLPAEQSAPEPLPEGEPSPFSPADENSDDPFAPEEEQKDSLIMPSKAAAATTTTIESAASSSIGNGGLGATEQSALATDPLGGGSAKRDWRVHASSNHDLDAIFESEGGNSVDDYKLRAHILEESAVFFTALKNQESSSLVR